MSDLTKKFLFDECLGKPLMELLHQLVSSECEFLHICDFFASGTPDAVWIPEIAKAGGYIVITADAGKNPKKKERKLPDLCAEYKVTHVIMSAKLHEQKGQEKVAALASVWDEIDALEKEPPGSRFRLRFKDSKSLIQRTFALDRVEYDVARKGRRNRPGK